MIIRALRAVTSTMTDSLDLSPQFTGIPRSLAECSLLSYLPAKSAAGRLMFATLVAVGDVFPSREHKQLREARKQLREASFQSCSRNHLVERSSEMCPLGSISAIRRVRGACSDPLACCLGRICSRTSSLMPRA